MCHTRAPRLIDFGCGFQETWSGGTRSSSFRVVCSPWLGSPSAQRRRGVGSAMNSI